MSRSGYGDDCDGWRLIMWRGAVASAIRGERGQMFLRALLKALDEMPEKILIEEDLESDGKYCALGAVGKAYGIKIDDLDPTDHEEVSSRFHISQALAREIVFENDEGGHWQETPEARWRRVRAWVSENISWEST